MKKLLIVFMLCVWATGSNAQIATEPRTEEYSTIRVVISGADGKIAPSGNQPNPYFEMEGAGMELKDYVKDPKGTKFESVTDMINYMNKFGWTLLTTDAVELNATKNGDYLLIYTFKRKPKK